MTSSLRPFPRPAPASSSRFDGALDNTEIASNFTTFLQLLTTQLKNQNPLDPLDTNQFTQQLVQFAQVEQQMKSNDQLSSLVSLEKSAQATHGAGLCRRDRGGRWLDGAADQWQATWTFNVTQALDRHHHDQGFRPARPSIPARLAVNPGNADVHLGRPRQRRPLWPDGNYTLTATAVDASNQSVAISTEVQAVVDSVDLTQSPPVLSINGQNYTLDKIKRIVGPPDYAR